MCPKNVSAYYYIHASCLFNFESKYHYVSAYYYICVLLLRHTLTLVALCQLRNTRCTLASYAYAHVCYLIRIRMLPRTHTSLSPSATLLDASCVWLK